MNKKLLNAQLAENNISSTLNSDESGGLPTIYLAKRAMRLLKAVSFAQAATNMSAVKQLGWSLNILLKSCYFNGVQCSISDFFSWFSFDYGNCYTFNYRSSANATLRQTSSTGSESGLTLELFNGFSGKENQIFKSPKRRIKGEFLFI